MVSGWSSGRQAREDRVRLVWPVALHSRTVERPVVSGVFACPCQGCAGRSGPRRPLHGLTIATDAASTVNQHW